jgi:DNA-nicking Smr family endonuclease
MAKTVPQADRALWHAAMHDVRPLRRIAAPASPVTAPAAPPAAASRSPTSEAAPAAAPRRAPAPPLQHPPSQHPPLDRLAGIDRANAERLKRGRHPIEARLDLHGLTQAEAHAALSSFVSRSRRQGRRCVLVITGRGLGGRGLADRELADRGLADRGFGGEAGGILRRAVPRWLAEAALRPHILALTPAQPQHGGAGALYVLLRRPPRA